MRLVQFSLCFFDVRLVRFQLHSRIAIPNIGSKQEV